VKAKNARVKNVIKKKNGTVKKHKNKNVRLKIVRAKNMRVQKCQSKICDIKKMWE